MAIKAAAITEANEDNFYLSSTSHESGATTLAGAKAKSTTEAEKLHTGAKRVLVADDNRDAREALAIFLKLMGYVVETARDGSTALELARTFQPQLVILDVLMPGANGFQTAELLREQPLLRDVVIVTMTGWQQSTDDWLAKHVGADYHLLKPLSTEALQDILQKHLPV